MNSIVRQIQGIHSNAVPTGLLLTVTNTDIEVLIITVGQLKWLRSFFSDYQSLIPREFFLH